MNTNSLTTNSKWLNLATEKLNQSHIKSARLDALLILEKVLAQPKIDLVANNDIEIDSTQLGQLNDLLDRRVKDEPIAYLIGYKEFYGRDFFVDKEVLIPRPESEAFIELIKNLEIEDLKLADIGCGSGCLGISAKLELPELEVELFDTSKEALKIAKVNSDKLGASVKTIQANLLDKLQGDYGVLLVNLPYVPNELMNANNLSYEPPQALFAGIDGMDLYREFWEQVKILATKPKYILCESLASQHNQMTSYAKTINYKLIKTDNLVQLYKSS
jgi:release factor glutamine methyltransferase